MGSFTDMQTRFRRYGFPTGQVAQEIAELRAELERLRAPQARDNSSQGKYLYCVAGCVLRLCIICRLKGLRVTLHL